MTIRNSSKLAGDRSQAAHLCPRRELYLDALNPHESDAVIELYICYKG